MRSRASRLRALTQDPGLEATRVRPGPRPRLDTRLHAPGLPLGSLVSLQGPAATEALLRLLAEHAAKPAAWVEQKLSAYPPGWAQRGVPLQRLLFVEAGADLAWAATELVRSQAFPLVAIASPLPDERSLQRLRLAAERSRAVVLLNAPLPAAAWPVRLRLWARWDGEGLRVEEGGGALEHDDTRVEVGA